MRLQISTALAALLVSVGLITITPTTATAAQGFRCNISQVDNAASSLQSSRSYLSAHRSTSSWKRYVPRVSSYYTAVADCFTGGVRTQLRGSQQSFLGHYRAKRWSKGIAELDATIKLLRKVVTAYRNTNGNICPAYC